MAMIVFAFICMMASILTCGERHGLSRSGTCPTTASWPYGLDRHFPNRPWVVRAVMNDHSRLVERHVRKHRWLKGTGRPAAVSRRKRVRDPPLFRNRTRAPTLTCARIGLNACSSMPYRLPPTVPERLSTSVEVST